jgi:hypothetical protein
VESDAKRFGLDVFKLILKQPIAAKHNGDKRILCQVQGEKGNEEPPKHHHEEWKEGRSGHVPNLRDQDVQNRWLRPDLGPRLTPPLLFLW